MRSGVAITGCENANIRGRDHITSTPVMRDFKPRTHLDAGYRNAMRTRANGLPTVSVVAVAGDDPDAAIREMSACYAKWAHFGVELIVVCGADETWRPAMAALPQGLRIVFGPADANDAQLRSLGLASAEGDLVMLVDDLVLTDESWISHLRGAGRALESTHA